MSLIPLNTSQVFSVLFVFLFFWLTWALVLRTALLQPSCKGGNKLREWQNKVEWNPRIAALCYFYVHRFFPSACCGVSNGLALPSSSIMFSAHVNCCGVRVFQRHAVGKVSCQKQACPQLIRRLRDWIWLIKHPPCRHGVCSAAREKKKKRQAGRGEKAQDGAGACAWMSWHSLPSPTDTLQELAALPPPPSLCAPRMCAECWAGAPTLHAFTPAVTPAQGVLVFCIHAGVWVLKCGLPEAVWGGVVPALVHALCVCEGVRSALFYMCACVAALSWFCVCFSLVNLFPLIRATFHAVKKRQIPSLCACVCICI